MQLVHITLSPLQRRHRVAYAVTAVDAERPESGEHVVIRDQSGAWFGAVVVASSYDETGRGTHQLRLGAALPESIARRRLDRAGLLVPQAEVLHQQVEQFLAEAAAFQAGFATGGAEATPAAG